MFTRVRTGIHRADVRLNATSLVVLMSIGILSSTPFALALSHGLGTAKSPIVRTTAVNANAFALVEDVRDNRIFVVSQGPADAYHIPNGPGYVTALNATTGHVVCRTRVGILNYGGLIDTFDVPPALQAVAVDDRTRRVFIASVGKLVEFGMNISLRGPGRVYVVDATNCHLLRTIGVGRDPFAVAVDARAGRAYVSNLYGGMLSVLDATTGTVLHTVTVRQGVGALVVDERTNRVFVRGNVGITVLSAVSGRIIARIRPPGDNCSMALDEHAGRVIIGSGTGSVTTTVSALDASTGAVVYVARLQAATACAIAVDEITGHAFVYTSGYFEGGAYSAQMLDSRSGRVLRGVALPGPQGVTIPASLAVDQRVSRAFVAAYNSSRTTVTVLNAQTGQRLSTIYVGRGVPAMVVDERTNRLFVLNTSDDTVSVIDTTRL